MHRGCGSRSRSLPSQGQTKDTCKIALAPGRGTQIDAWALKYHLVNIQIYFGQSTVVLLHSATCVTKPDKSRECPGFEPGMSWV